MSLWVRFWRINMIEGDNMEPKKALDVSLIPYEQSVVGTTFDLDQIIYDLDSQIELLSSQADTLDYLVAVASGVLCGMLDVL